MKNHCENLQEDSQCLAALYDAFDRVEDLHYAELTILRAQVFEPGTAHNTAVRTPKFAMAIVFNMEHKKLVKFLNRCWI